MRRVSQLVWWFDAKHRMFPHKLHTLKPIGGQAHSSMGWHWSEPRGIELCWQCQGLLHTLELGLCLFCSQYLNPEP